jgi:hypothetical protein
MEKLQYDRFPLDPMDSVFPPELPVLPETQVEERTMDTAILEAKKKNLHWQGILPDTTLAQVGSTISTSASDPGMTAISHLLL